MKIGDLVRCTFNDYGIGIVMVRRPNGGYIVSFPNCVRGLSKSNLEVIVCK